MYTVASRPFLSKKIKINDNYYQKLIIDIFIRKLWYYHIIPTSLIIKNNHCELNIPLQKFILKSKTGFDC